MSRLQLPLYDLGTPKPHNATGQVSLEVDGQSIHVDEGTSVMRAAALLGINVPKLCATDSLDAFGSCRLCLVEIEGRRGTPASCTTLVEDGMKVTTQSGQLSKTRKNVLELYISWKSRLQRKDQEKTVKCFNGRRVHSIALEFLVVERPCSPSKSIRRFLTRLEQYQLS